ncbi:Flp family type IVb pilin [Variovorax sp. LT1R16]|uniref:Flp family type IVb pilin n=1 Tax=Variovorax sp. LT1R16 TaxID=3443728 RepID=UPI003F4578BD
MSNAIMKFLRDEEGATAIEYGLIAGLISAILVGVLTNIGTSLEGVFETINTALGGTNPA